VESYNTAHALEEYNIHFKYPFLTEYRQGMRNAIDYLFQPQPNSAPETASATSLLTEAILRQLEVDSAVTDNATDQLPLKVYTTSKGVEPDYSDLFEWWKQRSPELEIINYDDTKTLHWLRSMFPAEPGEKEVQLVRGFESLTRGIFRCGWVPNGYPVSRYRHLPSWTLLRQPTYSGGCSVLSVLGDRIYLHQVLLATSSYSLTVGSTPTLIPPYTSQ
jgi:hypothetical protein